MATLAQTSTTRTALLLGSWLCLALLIGWAVTCAPTPTPPPPPAKDPFAGSLFRIGFGSCNLQFRAQPHWAQIMARKPHLWIWGGDVIYGDTYDMSRLKTSYQQQLQNPGYKELMASVPIIGVWDDHDYGFNDVDGTYPHKVPSQQLFLDFIQEPPESPRRKQEGIYATKTYEVGQRTLRVILLDLRYHKGPVGTDLLGDAQWSWLKQTLSSSKAALHFVVSSTQILRDDTSKDTWAQYPKSRERLFSLLKKHDIRGTLLLTGDIHVGEISRSQKTGVGYPIYEFTSSGLTHTEAGYNLTNAHRLTLIRERNFGMIDLIPDGTDLAIHLQLYHIDGTLRAHQKLSLASLQPTP